MSSLAITKDMLFNSWKRGISFADYCYLNFYDLDFEERKKYIGTAEIYEFQKRMNNKSDVKFFNNKILFNKVFEKYCYRSFLNINKVSEPELSHWLSDKTEFIAKPSEGTVGKGIQKITPSEFKNTSSLIAYLKENKLDLVEEVILQNKDLNKLNSSSVNTIRVMTVLNENKEVKILGAAIRLGVGKVVDNFNAGGIAAPIDIETGTISRFGVSKNIQDEKKYYEHPVSKVKLTGFQIPHWDKVLDIVKKACHEVETVRTVGWDVAIGEENVLLVEGNHNWCKNFFQQVEMEGKRDQILSCDRVH